MHLISTAVTSPSSSMFELEVAASSIGTGSEGETHITDPHDLLAAYCTMRGFMASGHSGVDGPRGARQLLKDYVSGKILYCHPPPNDNDGKRRRESRKQDTARKSRARGTVLNALRDPTLKEIVEVELENDDHDDTSMDFTDGMRELQGALAAPADTASIASAKCAGAVASGVPGSQSVASAASAAAVQTGEEEDVDFDLSDLDDDNVSVKDSKTGKRMHKKANRRKRGRKGKIRSEDPYREEEERRSLGITTNALGYKTLGKH